MKDEFEEISRMLSIFENPLRRKILHRLVSDACYPLQLSKELRVSQQAIMKHLDVLERCGIVRSRSEKSENAGPPRKSYYPIRRVSMVLDFGPHLYDVRVYVDDRLPLPDRTEDNVGKEERNDYSDLRDVHLKRISQRANPERFRKVIRSIMEMNQEIERLDAWRLSMVRQKEALLREAYTLAKDLTSSILEMKVLSLAIERGLADVNDYVITMIADELDIREKEVEEILMKYKELLIQDDKENKEQDKNENEQGEKVKISNAQRKEKNKR